MYGKATETAIAAMSRLAEVYDGGATRLSAADIAETRGLQKPFVSKLLSTLANAGFVVGARGPGGGFALARHPRRIRLNDIFKLFEREDESLACPFGGGVCGRGEPCPLHEKLVQVQEAMEELLHHTTFEVFRTVYQDQDEARRPSPAGKRRKKRRASYRAPQHRSGRGP